MPKPRRKQSSKLDSRFPGRGGAQGRGGGAAGRGPGAQTTAPKVEMSARAEARVRRALEAVSLDARSSSASTRRSPRFEAVSLIAATAWRVRDTVASCWRAAMA